MQKHYCTVVIKNRPWKFAITSVGSEKITKELVSAIIFEKYKVHIPITTLLFVVKPMSYIDYICCCLYKTETPGAEKVSNRSAQYLSGILKIPLNLADKYLPSVLQK